MVPKFEDDLSLGKKGEKFFLELIQKKYKDAYQTLGKQNYDIIIPGKFNIECKLDRYSKNSESIAIEYECNGKPSGISLRADYYGIIYHLDGWVYSFVDIETLDWICRDIGKKVSGGDGGRSKMYLINKVRFMSLVGANKIN